MATFHVALNNTDLYFEVKPHNFQNLAGWLPRMSIFVPFVVLLFSVFQAIFQKISQSVKYQVKGFFAVKVPEPFTELPSYPVIGPLLHLLCNRNDLPNLFIDWAVKFGPNVKTKIFGKDFLFTNDPLVVQKLLMSVDSGHVNKPDLFYKVAFPVQLGEGLVSSESITWKAHRNILFKAFTYEALKSYLPIFNDGARKLVTDLQETVLTPKIKANSFLDNIHLSTFGIISRIVTGTDMVTESDCSRFYDNFHRCQEIVTYRLLHPWLFVDPLWKLHPLKKEMDECINHIESGIRMLLKEKRQQQSSSISDSDNEKGIHSLMDIMMSSNMTDLEILVEMTSFLLAGHDTVSVSLNFLMINLAKHPAYQKICREEVDKMFENMLQNEESMSNEITMDTLSELKYLERCIKESLRLYPTIPLFVRELKAPLKIDDNIKLEPGVSVLISPWTLHRHPDYYPNPEKFDPERFTADNCRNRSSYAYIPFSAGARNCIGWKMAMYEMKILAAYILRHFEISTSQGQDDIKLQFHIVLSMEKNVNFILKKRQ